MTRADPGKLILIDGNSLLYRAFFALPPLTNAEGQMTNAAYGFTTMLLKIIDEEQPDMMAVAFDLPGPTFRHQRFAEYKATRDRMPDELSPQIGMAREVLDAMQIPAFEMEGYEADDIIGTLATQAEAAGHRVLVVTGDLDELQLVSDRVSVMVTRRGISETRVYDAAAVKDRYGLGPERLADFRALRGDTSDNIPGVPGIGEKTASKLVEQFGSLEQLLERVEEVRPARIAAALEAHAELARRAKELSLLVRDLPIPFELERLRHRPPDRAKLGELFQRLGFRSLLPRVDDGEEAIGAEHRLLRKPREGKAFAAKLLKVREIVVVPIADDGPALRTPLRGICVLSEGDPVVVMEEALEELLPLFKSALEAPDIGKVGHDLKRLALLLSRRGVVLRGMTMDTMIASHLLNPAQRNHDLRSTVYQHLGLVHQGQPSLDHSDEGARAAAAAGYIAALKKTLADALEERELTPLFRDLEMPLIPVLADMEVSGIAVDVPALESLSARLARSAAELERDIHALAGEEFTIGSPKQLQRILFDKLGLPPDKSKRTKTGYSTDADVLAGLSEFEIVAKILSYREVTKLRSTYVEALPKLVDPETGRLHTSLNQAVTATGRLSSTEPNLQNIPVRTELGMEIRRAFVPGRPDYLLLSADYSQIELRILAHITEDENLIEIFRRDEDLHRAAAAEIFGVAPDRVEPRMRSFAKMVNYGIPYGISEFRLAREMGISVEEAGRYVRRYFGRFPKLHAYVEEMPREARSRGYVVTLMGRRRYLPELRARAPAVRQAAERMAINTPIQGSAADIIKLAMLRVSETLAERRLRGRMLLQVHDELLFDVHRDDLEETARVAAQCMSGAYDLRVPLKVDTKAGPNWLDTSPVDGGNGCDIRGRS